MVMMLAYAMMDELPVRLATKGWPLISGALTIIQAILLLLK